MAEEKTLWQQFNLAENNPDPGRGILYCLKYPKDRLISYQDKIAASLIRRGVRLRNRGVNIHAELRGGSNKSRIYELFVRLSCVNEALEFAEAGFDRYRSLRELKEGLITNYYTSLVETEGIAEAYEFVDLAIPEIVRDIRISEARRASLSEEDLAALNDLDAFAARQRRRLNRPNGLVTFG